MKAYKITVIGLVGSGFNCIRDVGYIEIAGPRGGGYILDSTCAIELVSAAFGIAANKGTIVNMASRVPSKVSFLVNPVTEQRLRTRARTGKMLLLGVSGKAKARELASKVDFSSFI